MRTHAATVDWSFADSPIPSTPSWHGLARSVIVGPQHGAVHTEMAVGALVLVTYRGDW